MNPGARIPLPGIWKGCCLFLVLLLACILCGRITHPWTYNDDYNGAFWSQAARNFAQAGYLPASGVPAPLYFGPPPIPKDAFYVHHPTLLPALAYLDRLLLGESEAAARALPILFSLLTALALCAWSTRALGWPGSAFVLGLFAAAPMELHYGQMVNFEAPGLFFITAALLALDIWSEERSRKTLAIFLACSGLAMWMDWQGYLVAILLMIRLVIPGGAARRRTAFALMLIASALGMLFLVQIRLASPNAWDEFLGAFRQRSGQGNPAGGSFTLADWARTQATYLTTLFHPVALAGALAGTIIAAARWRELPARARRLLAGAAIVFFADSFYLCLLRNQSYIHDFAGFYFLLPVAVFGGFALQWLCGKAGRHNHRAEACAAVLVAALIALGIRRLNGIDTQFCILGDNDSEPETLMPDVGRLVDRTFPPGAVILCNFDPYYSPLPYYARHVMANNLISHAEWNAAVAENPGLIGGIIWKGQGKAADLLTQIPRAELHPVTVDGVGFYLWTPRPTGPAAAGMTP